MTPETILVFAVMAAIAGVSAWVQKNRKNSRQRDSIEYTRDSQMRRLSAWHIFARSNKLRFEQEPYSFYMEGEYRGHFVQAEYFFDSQGDSIPSTVITLLRQESNFNTGDRTQHRKQLFKRLTSSGGSDGFLAGITVIEGGGEAFTFETDGSMGKQREIRGVLNRLCDLADVYLEIVEMGGEIIPAFEKMVANNQEFLPIQKQLVEDIGRDTQTRFGKQLDRVLCRHCLTRYKAWIIDFEWWQLSKSYCGCRQCKRSRDPLVGMAVAVLDNQMSADVEPAGDRLRVNSLRREKLFDFDEVAIVRAGDEAVERFAVRVGNDTDLFRRGRYTSMRCLVSPECGLSENTMRILRRTFGQVQLR